nr:uncharacterized protein LOC111419836 [Onthophagus taurus]
MLRKLSPNKLKKKESLTKKKDDSTDIPTLENAPYEGKKKKSKKRHHSPKKNKSQEKIVEKIKHKKVDIESTGTESSSESSRNHHHRKISHHSPHRKEKLAAFHSEVTNILNSNLNQKLAVKLPICSRKHDVATNKTKYSPSTSQYISEIATQHPICQIPILTQHPELEMLKDAGDQTAMNSNEQQTQITSEITHFSNQYKYPINPCTLMKRLEGLDQRICPKNSLEVNSTSPFVHAACQPCVEELNKVEEVKVIESESQQNYDEATKEVDYEVVFEPFDCSAFNKSFIKSSAPTPKMISEINTCHYSKTNQPCQTSLQNNFQSNLQSTCIQSNLQTCIQSNLHPCIQTNQKSLIQKNQTLQTSKDSTCIQAQIQQNQFLQTQKQSCDRNCQVLENQFQNFNVSHHRKYNVEYSAKKKHGFPNYVHQSIYKTRIAQPKYVSKSIRCDENFGMPCPGLKSSYDESGLDKKMIMIRLLPRKETYCCWGRRSSWEGNKIGESNFF